MTVFEKLMDDIFDNEDFTEKVLFKGNYYTCIASSIEDGISFTDAGTENAENFTLDLKLPMSWKPKVNDQIKFRDKIYKIASIATDSANTSIKLTIVAVSQGIGK